MDAFVLKRVAGELDASLRGALVSAVHQPAEREIVLLLWTGRGEKRLLLSADPQMCRIHLSTRKAANPPRPPRFCQYLRRHLEGMRIRSVCCLPFDRLARIEFFSSLPDALHERTVLYAELFGRHANLVYVGGDGVILEPLRPVGPQESRIRELAPGLPYLPLPRPGRIFLPDVTEADAGRIFALGRAGLDRALLAQVLGIGPDVAREVAAAGAESPAALFAAIRELVRRYKTDDFAPGIGTLPGGSKRLLPFPCPAAGFVDFTAYPTANAAADAFFTEAAEAREAAQISQRLRGRIAALLRKERTKLEKVQGDRARLEEGLKAGEMGETLKAHLSELRKGMTEFRGIPLDPGLTPVENMARCFHLHKKAKGAIGIVRQRLREVAESVYYLETLEEQLSRAATRDDLVALRRELSSAFPEGGKKEGAKKKAPVKRKRAAEEKWASAKVEETTFGGHTILVGKDNAGCDRIVKELAAPDDLWLHVQGIPGSHVLIKRKPGQEVPEAVIEEAARLAVYHSKARGSSNVSVFLAQARHVSKFRGAKPGLVRIAKFRTIAVR